jgi:hypothetical protein
MQECLLYVTLEALTLACSLGKAMRKRTQSQIVEAGTYGVKTNVVSAGC